MSIADLDESTPGGSDIDYPLEAETVGGVIGELISDADAEVRISNVTVDASVKLKSSKYGGAAIGCL